MRIGKLVQYFRCRGRGQWGHDGDVWDASFTVKQTATCSLVSIETALRRPFVEKNSHSLESYCHNLSLPCSKERVSLMFAKQHLKLHTVTSSHKSRG